MSPASWLPLAAGGEFTQPRDYLSADPFRPDIRNEITEELGRSEGG